MIDNRTIIRAISAPWNAGVDLLVRKGEEIGVYVAMKRENTEQKIDPTLSIRCDEAQTLMDDLWNAGFRPTEGTGSAGSLRATEKHLNDMRRIVAKQLGIDFSG